MRGTGVCYMQAGGNFLVNYTGDKGQRMEFQRAVTEDLDILRRIAYHSEAHWGYSDTFMDIFDRIFNITEDFIKRNPVYVGYVQKEIAGFWGLQCREEQYELEYFYIHQEYLNQGLGKLMWGNLTAWCREHKISGFRFVTSHQAVGFYEKMGALVMGQTLSSIDGREIPQLCCKIQDIG